MAFSTIKSVIPNVDSFASLRDLSQIECYLYLLVSSLERRTYLVKLQDTLKSYALSSADELGSSVLSGRTLFGERLIVESIKSESWILIMSVSNMFDSKQDACWNSTKQVIAKAHSDSAEFLRQSPSKDRTKKVHAIRNSRIAHLDVSPEVSDDTDWNIALEDCSHLLDWARESMMRLYQANDFSQPESQSDGTIRSKHQVFFEFLCDLWSLRGQERAESLIALYESKYQYDELQQIVLARLFTSDYCQVKYDRTLAPDHRRLRDALTEMLEPGVAP
jgi:hypothetical protein